MRLIAAKPVKPCDRGVFWAFYLLLFLQRSHRRCLRPGFRRATESGPQPLHSAPLCLLCRHACCRLGGPSAPFAQSAATKTASVSSAQPAHATAILRRFRYRFDSSQVRQTVRQGRFQGLGFAPVFAVKPRRCWRPCFRRATRKRPATFPFGAAVPALPTCLLTIGRPIRSIYSTSRNQNRKRLQYQTRPGSGLH